MLTSTVTDTVLYCGTGVSSIWLAVGLCTLTAYAMHGGRSVFMCIKEGVSMPTKLESNCHGHCVSGSQCRPLCKTNQDY